jgi:Tol biopolymer transport system component/predicted Ser/Thr protein kinase
MPFQPGDTLGPYEITEPIGQGGMGQVWKARDTRLDRIVAIKTSNEQFTERFEHEARAVAALNHPHICTLHDVGPNYLVMEYVEGTPLAGPLPLDAVLRIAKQIATALEAAHEKHITHRDLKPGNILLKPDGTVKVLDFGLAKITAPMRADLSPEHSPTMSMALTQVGMIVGTAAYMAPEQAKGKAVDKRADIWAFGVIVYELATGTKPFAGSDMSEILASVIKEQPDLEQLPRELRRLVRKCLEKDPAKRLRDIGDAWDYLDLAEPATVQPPRTSKLPWAVAAIATLAAFAAIGWGFAGRTATSPPGPVTRFTIAPESGVVLSGTMAAGAQQVMSPDGRYLAYVADNGQDARGRQGIWIRSIDSLAAQRLENTAGALEPFWSPDSKQLAFFVNDGKIKRIPVTGGSAVNVTDYSARPPNGRPNGGVWYMEPGASDEGVILWADDAGPIHRVSAGGGVATNVTTLSGEEKLHAYPQVVPDRRTLLFHSSGGQQEGIWAQDLQSGARTFLFSTKKRAIVGGPDLLLFMRDTTLFGQRWNWSTLKPAGEPAVIADYVRTSADANGTARMSASSSLTGTLVYRSGASTGAMVHRWYATDGKPGDVIGQPGVGGAVEISPDGRWAAAYLSGNLELLDISTGTLAILDTGVSANAPHWSPDSRRVIFSKRDGTYQAVIGTGKSTLLYPDVQDVTDWTKDGLILGGTLLGGGGKVAILAAPPENATGKQAFEPRVLGDIRGDQFRVSPDGKWLTYSAPATAQTGGFYRDIWIASYPSLANRRLVAGGTEPKWSADGRLVFGRESVLYAVDVKPGPIPTFSAPKELFRGAGTSMGGSANVWGWALTPDGTRVLARSFASAATSGVEEIYVVQNWPALVK